MRQYYYKSSKAKPTCTPAENAFYNKVAIAIGNAEITADSVSQCITSLQSLVVRDLREKGACQLPGLVTFTRVDVKAQPAHYLNLSGYTSKLVPAKGPQRRVFGRVP